MKNENKKKQIALIILAVVLIVPLFVYSLTITIKVSNCEKLDYNYQVITTNNRVYKYLKDNLNYDYEAIDRDVLRNKITSVVGLNHYVYKECSRLNNGEAYGRTFFALRQISVVNYLNINVYIDTFCHEAIHLKYYNSNERWTTYKTFVVLFESNDKDLKQCAINWAYRYVSYYTIDEYGRAMNNSAPARDYDPAHYIIQYLSFRLG